MGSPPHTREAPAPGCSEDRGSRITPAYAGSTQQNLRKQIPFQDHPRIRGKHYLSRLKSPVQSGSPPHTREALDVIDDLGRHVRITPAYAGSTLVISWKDYPSRDHPRIRGKHPHTGYHISLHRGSPPHTREARGQISKVSHSGGITPAYAGSTNRTVNSPCLLWDHPRIRGKHRLQKRPHMRT